MQAYSLDLRERIIRACEEEGYTRQEVADWFGVSRSFRQKLLRRHEDGDSIAPQAAGKGPAPTLGQEELHRLAQLGRAHADATREELCNLLEASKGPSVSLATMCRALQTLGLSLKKSRCTPTSGTRRACKRCGGTGGGKSVASTCAASFLSMKAGSTPR
jgi:transposase